MINSVDIARRVLAVIQQMHPNRQPTFIPSADALSRTIDDVFWTSLEPYEGSPVRIRIFFVDAARLGVDGFVYLVRPEPMSVATLRSNAPAHADDGGLLLSETTPGEASIIGFRAASPFVNAIPSRWLRIESNAPGNFRIFTGMDPVLDFRRGKIRQLGGMAFDRTYAELLLVNCGLFGAGGPPAWQRASAAVDIAFTIEALGKGGAIWILPNQLRLHGEIEGLGKLVLMHEQMLEPYKEDWEMRTSLLRLNNPPRDCGHDFLWVAAQEWDTLRRNAYRRTVASLLGVDGAVVMNGALELLAFGVICNRFTHPARAVQLANDPRRPGAGAPAEGLFMGSRHRSAIDFCSSFAPAGALVASHDGGITVFGARERGEVVSAPVSLIRSEPEFANE